MSDSKKGSTSDLNESNMPLLEDDQAEKAGETPEKEQIELKEAVTEEKDDSAETEKTDKKKKKEKKKKEPKEKKPKGPNCIDTLSAGLDMGARDGKAINACIDLDFDDVLAEPNTAQGFDMVWRLSFVLFAQTKLWIYRVLSALLAVPLALVWGLVFSLLTVLYVWILAPAFKIFDLVVAVFRRAVVGLLSFTIEPVANAFGGLFAGISVNQRRHIVAEA